MKVIISHDVDHLTPWEHLGDLYTAKVSSGEYHRALH